MDTVKKGDDSGEVEIYLGDSSDPEESEDEEEPQTLWRAQPSVDEEEDIHTSTLVEISDTKPLINSRDPRGINACLKVEFEDVIAEPPSVRSGDRVWIWSNALFEVSRVWIYRIVTVLLAIPMSLISGLLLPSSTASTFGRFVPVSIVSSLGLAGYRVSGASCCMSLWSHC